MLAMISLPSQPLEPGGPGAPSLAGPSVGGTGAAVVGSPLTDFAALLAPTGAMREVVPTVSTAVPPPLLRAPQALAEVSEGQDGGPALAGDGVLLAGCLDGKPAVAPELTLPDQAPSTVEIAPAAASVRAPGRTAARIAAPPPPDLTAPAPDADAGPVEESSSPADRLLSRSIQVEPTGAADAPEGLEATAPDGDEAADPSTHTQSSLIGPTTTAVSPHILAHQEPTPSRRVTGESLSIEVATENQPVSDRAAHMSVQPQDASTPAAPPRPGSDNPPRAAAPPVPSPAVPAPATPPPAVLHAAATATASGPADEPVVRARPGFVRELGLVIARHGEAGAEQLTVRMHPAELGRIHVRLDFDDGGRLRALVSSDSPQLLDVLRRDLPDLTRALGDAGVRADERSFRFERGDGGTAGGGGASDGQRFAGGGAGGEDRRQPRARDAQLAWQRPSRRSGNLDLLA